MYYDAHTQNNNTEYEIRCVCVCVVLLTRLNVSRINTTPKDTIFEDFLMDTFRWWEMCVRDDDDDDSDSRKGFAHLWMKVRKSEHSWNEKKVLVSGGNDREQQILFYTGGRSAHRNS